MDTILVQAIALMIASNMKHADAIIKSPIPVYSSIIDTENELLVRGRDLAWRAEMAEKDYMLYAPGYDNVIYLTRPQGAIIAPTSTQ